MEKKNRKKIWKKKWFRYSTIGLIVLLVSGELIARHYLGLGEVPIYIKSNTFEYIYSPNQAVKRFGNNIQTNAQSMRSRPLKKTDKQRILLIGDSVINGGPHVDQGDLVTTLLEEYACTQADCVRVLNISAGSWGPDNALAYIKENGHFEAQQMILVFSSHDYHDNMHHKEVVGVHPNWPKNQPLLALTDGWSKYAWPRIQSFLGTGFDEYAYLYGHVDTAVNKGWTGFIEYCDTHSIKLKVYLHPEREEHKAKAFNKNGEGILTLLEDHEIEVINGLKEDHHLSEYRDEIHLNGHGHERLAEILKSHLFINEEADSLSLSLQAHEEKTDK